MLTFENGGRLIQDVAELPNFVNAYSVFCDVETSSGSPLLDSLNPWHNCKVAGFGIAADDSPAYYVDYARLPAEQQTYARNWLNDTLETCKQWVNHNIKYDAHVIANDLGIVPNCPLVDTLTLAKIIDSDRVVRGGYGLDALSKGWLKKEIGDYEKTLQPYLGKRNKDYGAIPGDVIAPYGCQDILTDRELYEYEQNNCPEQCYGVWQTEIELTGNLWQMERNGLRVEPQELKIAEMVILNTLCEIDEKLTKLVGRAFRPHVSDDLFDVFCNQYGLPILAYTKDAEGNETCNASFDKHALKMYAAHPGTPQEVLELVLQYKQLSQRLGLFIEPWQKFMRQSDLIWLIHSTYNQCVRTGRMSCSEPNMQQLDKVVKRLIKPKEGYSFVSIDYSQIEFRFIGHYIKSPVVIEAYKENPDADFHKLVAEWCEIKRRPAKTVNFGVAFGEGKGKLKKQLAGDVDLIGTIRDEIRKATERGELLPNQATAEFNRLADMRAEQVWNKYHNTFPTLKATARAAENALKMKGYVYNMYGRHRHLPFDKAYRAFNTVNQSSAADLIKERFNEICRAIVGTPIETQAIVHDEAVFQMPTEIANDFRTKRDLVSIMESPAIEKDLRVPIRCAIGVSSKHWAEASSDETQKPLYYNKAESDNLNWLK